MNILADTVVKKFVESFSSQPQLYFSPGRINLIGEHVDYNDGFVMPAAIDKGVYYAIAENDTEEIHFYAADFDEWLSVNVNDIRKLNSWKKYVLSVANEFILLGKKIKGFNCVFAGDVPRGSGMSSSAAVEGGLAFALNELLNVGLNRVELAKLCQRAEHNYPGVNCGIMDQFANMMGKKGNVLLLDCRSLEYQYFPLKLNDYTIVLLNSKVAHALASGEYNLRRQQCEEGLNLLKEKLNIRSFRDIGSAQNLLPYKNLMSADVYKRCLFVTGEIERTQKAALLLQQNNLAEFGKLMFETHEGLSKLYDVSCAELDFLAALAKKNPAVVGARLMGGGFGGCTINIVKNDAVNSFIDEAVVAYQKQFNIETEAYVVATSDGTGKL